MYAGEKAAEITRREAEVREAWAALAAACSARTTKLEDADHLYRFLNQVRTLTLWMDDVVRQMNTGEKPRYAHAHTHTDTHSPRIYVLLFTCVLSVLHIYIPGVVGSIPNQGKSLCVVNMIICSVSECKNFFKNKSMYIDSLVTVTQALPSLISDCRV